MEEEVLGNEISERLFMSSDLSAIAMILGSPKEPRFLFTSFEFSKRNVPPLKCDVLLDRFGTCLMRFSLYVFGRDQINAVYSANQQDQIFIRIK